MSEGRRVAKKAYTPGRAEAAKRPARDKPSCEAQDSQPTSVSRFKKSDLGAALSERITSVVSQGAAAHG